MSGFTDFFQPTPTPAPRPIEPVGFDIIRDLLMRKMFGLQANPYGLSGQSAAAPMQGSGGNQPFFSTGLNTSTPAFSGSFPSAVTSGGQPQQNFNPAFASLGGARRTDAQPIGGGIRAGQRVPMSPTKQPIGTNPASQAPSGMQEIMDMLNVAPRRHFDGGQYPGTNSDTARWFSQIMAGGINGVNQLLGGNYSNMNLGPQVNIPGYQFQGGQHEFGGNNNIANAAAGAGLTENDMARWLAQGQQARNANRTATLAKSPGYNASRWGTAAQRQGSGYGQQTSFNNWGRGGVTPMATFAGMNPGSHSAQGTTPQNLGGMGAYNMENFLAKPGGSGRVTPTLPTEGQNNTTTATRLPNTQTAPLMT